MADDSGRIQELEAQVQALRARLDRVEANMAPPSPLVTPPPVRPFTPGPFPAYPPPSAPRASGPSLEGVEQAIGKRIVPIVGAACIAVGIVSFCTYVVQQGWITRPVQFALAILATFALLLGGEVLRRRVPPLSPIVTGLGLLAGFATIVGGNHPLGVYGDETLLTLFYLWAAVNVAYGLWRGNQWMSCLGIAGGYVAAWMVVDRVPVVTALTVVTFLVAIAVACRHRWQTLFRIGLAGGVALAWTIGLEGFYTVNAPATAWIRAGVGFGFAVIAILTYQRAAPSLRDWLLPAGIPLAATWPFLLASTVLGGDQARAVGWLAMGIALVAIAVWGFRKDGNTRAQLVAPAYVFIGLYAPYALGMPTAQWIWLVAAILGGVGLALYMPRARSMVEWSLLGAGWLIWVGFSGITYTNSLVPTAVDSPILPRVYFYGIHGVIALLGLTAWSRVKALTGENRTAGDICLGGIYAGSAVAIALFGLLHYGGGVDREAASTLSMSLSGLGFLLGGFRTGRVGLRFGGFGWLAIAVGKLFLNDLAVLPLLVRVGLLFGLGLIALAINARYVRVSSVPDSPSVGDGG